MNRDPLVLNNLLFNEVECNELTLAQTTSALAHLTLGDPFDKSEFKFRDDCVWVTVAKLLGVDLIALDLALPEMRPQGGSTGIPDLALEAVVEWAGKKLL